MKDLLLAIVKNIVDHPEYVKVKKIDGASIMVLELSVAKQDLGMVIGKKGKNITAIRSIVGAAGAKHRKRVIVELLE